MRVCFGTFRIWNAGKNEYSVAIILVRNFRKKIAELELEMMEGQYELLVIM
jgi:hypothetical protein